MGMCSNTRRQHLRIVTMKSPLMALGIALLAATATFAQSTNHNMAGMDHAAMMGQGEPKEAGQSAFAAIQEIVALLDADPKTDWPKVDIEALRQHLIDMDSVTLRATVQVEPLIDGRKFSVSGEGPVVSSIQRMLVGHAATMIGKDGWKFAAETTDNGGVLVVKPPGAADMAKLDGLGFIGIMTMGMHHQEHHWMIAKGGHPH